MTQLFQCCSIPALTTVTIGVTPLTTLVELLQCLRALGQNEGPQSSLRHFSLRPSDGALRSFFNARVAALEWTLADILRPLCLFPEMETIHLCLLPQWGVYLADAEVERLVASWPNLLLLRIDLIPGIIDEVPAQA